MPCENCYIGEKLIDIVDLPDDSTVSVIVMGSHFRAVEYGIGRELR